MAVHEQMALKLFTSESFVQAVKMADEYVAARACNAMTVQQAGAQVQLL